MATTADISSLRDEMLQMITTGDAEQRNALGKLRTQVTVDIENLIKTGNATSEEVNKLKALFCSPRCNGEGPGGEDEGGGEEGE